MLLYISELILKGTVTNQTGLVLAEHQGGVNAQTENHYERLNNA